MLYIILYHASLNFNNFSLFFYIMYINRIKSAQGCYGCEDGISMHKYAELNG